jgi:hypothetical protein
VRASRDSGFKHSRASAAASRSSGAPAADAALSADAVEFQGRRASAFVALSPVCASAPEPGEQAGAEQADGDEDQCPDGETVAGSLAPRPPPAGAARVVVVCAVVVAGDPTVVVVSMGDVVVVVLVVGGGRMTWTVMSAMSTLLVASLSPRR